MGTTEQSDEKVVYLTLDDGPSKNTQAVLDILDSFGQRSQIRFTGMQLNPALPAGSFQFKPPAGADVVKQ